MDSRTKQPASGPIMQMSVTVETLRLTLDSSPRIGVTKDPESTLGAIVTLSVVFSSVNIGISFL